MQSLFNIRRVELHEENSTTRLGANSAVYVNEGHEDQCNDARLYDLREVFVCLKVDDHKPCITDRFDVV